MPKRDRAWTHCRPGAHRCRTGGTYTCSRIKWRTTRAWRRVVHVRPNRRPSIVLSLPPPPLQRLQGYLDAMDPDTILSHVPFTTSGSLVDCVDSMCAFSLSTPLTCFGPQKRSSLFFGTARSTSAYYDRTTSLVSRCPPVWLFSRPSCSQFVGGEHKRPML